MKLFRRFLMVLLPLMLIGAMFLFFPKLRPDISEFRELRGTDYQQGIEISKKGGTKRIEGYLNVVHVKGFIGFDLGKLRIAIRSDEPYSPYNRYFNVGGYRTYPILIDPLRTVKKPKAKPISPPTHSPFTAPGAMPANITELPGGTQIELGGKKLDFENGEITIDGQTFSTIEKPMLIVLRADHTIELIEEIKPGKMPDDVLVP